MLSTYQDFINHNPRYQQLKNDIYFQDIFNFLSKKENIVKMVEASKWNKPALSSCVNELESNYPELLNKDYTDYFIKQSVGAMIKVVLDPFGYVPNVQKRLPKKSLFFTSAHTYKYDKNSARLELIQTWEIKPL